MADFNKDEAIKALEIAIENTKNGKYEEALKSANEARLMNPELTDIKRLVTMLEVLSANPDITHYEILGVEETANENEIRLAYRKLAVNLNPDTNNFPKASEAFHRIFEATSVLLNDRLKYDSDLAVARGAHAQVAEFEAIRSKYCIVDREAIRRAFAYILLGKDFIVDHEAVGRAIAEHKAPKALGWAVAEGKAPDCTFDGMISSSEHQAHAQVAEFEAIRSKYFIVDREAIRRAFAYPLLGKDFIVDHEAVGRAIAEHKAPKALGWAVAEGKAPDCTFDGMISSSEHQAAFLKEKAGFEGAEFDAALWNDVVVTPDWRALFDVFDTSDGMISSSELKAAFEVYDKEPQSTTHHPSFQKRFVCSSNEVAGRGTKRSNTTQSTLTHPVPKKKMDGQGPLFFK